MKKTEVNDTTEIKEAIRDGAGREEATGDGAGREDGTGDDTADGDTTDDGAGDENASAGDDPDPSDEDEDGRKDRKEKKEKKRKNGKKKKRKKLSVLRIVIILILLAVFTFVTTAILWALKSWDVLTMDELLWHLKVSMKGSNPEMVKGFLFTTIGVTVPVTLIMGILLFVFRKKRKCGWILYRITALLTSAVFITGILSAWHGFGIGPFLKNYFTISNYIEDNYVDPGTVTLTFPEKKRNVIVIYLESMEVTFTDKESGGAFSENIIPQLTTMARENEDFSGNSDKLNGGIAFPGAVWTMGAMFATSSGLPLKTPLGQNGMAVNDDFMPGIVTLGDILEKEGYTNRLLLGSDATFGGRKLYYDSHGHYEIHDYRYAIREGLIPSDYYVWWGYEDDKLFSYAKKELVELAEEGKPFNYTMLTVDTHFEDGHWCPNCRYYFGNNRYANIMNCSNNYVYRFVEWLKTQDFYKDTTVIITGDHPTMDTDFCDDVPESYQRKTYTCVINSAVQVTDPDKYRTFSTFDLFPTTLAAMGVQIEGERLGLGTNLFSDKPTLTEERGVKETEDEISKRSKMMDRMYGGTYTSPFYKKED